MLPAIRQGNRVIGRKSTKTSAQYLEEKITVDQSLTRKMVSYQDNKTRPGFKWFRYKEGFSVQLVEHFLQIAGGKNVLDPFSGLGTTALTACKMGRRATGIDIMPVGNMAAEAISLVSDGLGADDIKEAADTILNNNDGQMPFPHVPITAMAFPPSTEKALACARHAMKTIKNTEAKKLMNFICMSILEDLSYTRKDGQFLRWDSRSGRNVAEKLNKGRLPTFREAFTRKIGEILADAPALKSEYGKSKPSIITSSSLEALRGIKSNSIHTVITSPPYANRYDYTRTYALELAWLGYDRNRLSSLRQSLLTATVENRPKTEMLAGIYGRSKILEYARSLVDDNVPLQKTLRQLRLYENELNNPNVIRLVENYFAEMAIIVTELGRIVKHGGNVFMVNDNVRYHGVGVPVDIILSGFAVRSGFECHSITTLPRGKGNSSQQMGRFGRAEMRKCVYRWQRR